MKPRQSCARRFRATWAETAIVQGQELGHCIIDFCLTVLERPTPGEIRRIGNQEMILWSTTAGGSLFDLSLEGGQGWQEITINRLGPGTLHWTVPDFVTDPALLRVCDSCIGYICTTPTPLGIEAGFTQQERDGVFLRDRPECQRIGGIGVTGDLASRNPSGRTL